MARWWRWPEDKQLGRVAWWTILRRLMFWPILLAGKSVLFLGVLGGFGLREAKESWREG